MYRNIKQNNKENIISILIKLQTEVGIGPGTERALDERDETSNKEQCTKNLTSVFQLRHTHGVWYDQNHTDIRAKTRQTILYKYRIANQQQFYSLSTSTTIKSKYTIKVPVQNLESRVRLIVR